MKDGSRRLGTRPWSQRKREQEVARPQNIFDEPGECITPRRVDTLHDGLTLYPFCPPIAFTIQRRTIQIRAPKDLALGRREMERRHKVCGRGETLDVREMFQRLREAMGYIMNKVQKKKSDRERPWLRTQLVERQVRADQLAFGPSVERSMCIGTEKGFQGLGRCVFGDDQRKRTSDDGGVPVEPWGEHGYAKRTCR